MTPNHRIARAYRAQRRALRAARAELTVDGRIDWTRHPSRETVARLQAADLELAEARLGGRTE